MSKKESEIFPSHSSTQEEHGDCPDCNAPLQIKHVGKSTFLACTSYPKCEYSLSLNSNDVVTLKMIENSQCPECKSQLAVKKGQYGMFIGCTNFPDCHYISSKQTKPKEEYEPVECPSCKHGVLNVKQNRFGKMFYACSNYPKCKYVLNHQPVAKRCESCGFSIMQIHSKDKKQLICPQPDCAAKFNDE